MRKVCPQLKVWFKCSGPPSKMQTINFHALNVSSLKGLLVAYEGRYSNKHNSNSV